MARILIVEDNDLVRWTLINLLRCEGHTVDHASDGRQTLDRCASCSFDAVLIDVYLDGLETCQRLRQTSAVPILMLSAHGDPSLRQRAMTSGANEFLVKPLDFRRLLQWVRDLDHSAPTHRLNERQVYSP